MKLRQNKFTVFLILSFCLFAFLSGYTTLNWLTATERSATILEYVGDRSFLVRDSHGNEYTASIPCAWRSCSSTSMPAVDSRQPVTTLTDKHNSSLISDKFSVSVLSGVLTLVFIVASVSLLKKLLAKPSKKKKTP
jgi:hypothetical protein